MLSKRLALRGRVAHAKGPTMLVGAIVAGLSWAGGPVYGATFNLIASDPPGTSSYTSPLSGATASGFNGPFAHAYPIAGFTYSTGALTIRGPKDVFGGVFAGDSLSIDTGGRLLIPGTGALEELRVNLILNGGLVDQAATANDHARSTLNGTILLNSASTLGALEGEELDVNSAISGSAPLSFGGTVNNNSDTGVVVLSSNNNSYTGATSILNGTKLALTNTANSATGSGPVTLAAGPSGALAGTGRSSGLLTVTSGSHLAPGFNTSIGAAGTLTVGSAGGLTLTDAAFDFDLSNTSSAPGGANDFLATGGLLTLGLGTFNFNELNGSLLTGVPYTLISGATDVTGASASSFFSSTTFTGGVTYTPTYAFDGNNNLTVTFAATPEPGTSGLLGICSAALLACRRRGASTR